MVEGQGYLREDELVLIGTPFRQVPELLQRAQTRCPAHSLWNAAPQRRHCRRFGGAMGKSLSSSAVGFLIIVSSNLARRIVQAPTGPDRPRPAMGTNFALAGCKTGPAGDTADRIPSCFPRN